MQFDNSIYLSGRINYSYEEVELSIESCICLFVYIYCDMDLKIIFIDDKETYNLSIPSKLFSPVNCLFSKKGEEDICDIKLLLPAVHVNEKTVFISGICSVMRWAIKDKLLKVPDHFSNSLLGFRGGCLVACTESSMWTKFCELQLPSSIYESSSFIKSETNEIPESLALLEAHLKRPVRTHNILKRKLDIAKKVKNVDGKTKDTISTYSQEDMKFSLYDDNNSPVQTGNVIENLKNLVITEKTTEFALNHCYLEGIDLTLADMIVFPCVHYFLKSIPSLANILKNVFAWYERMISNKQIRKAAERCGLCMISFPNSSASLLQKIVLPAVSQDSLYKRDPIHTKFKIKHQDPSEILFLLKESSIHPEYVESYCTQLTWDSLPEQLHPATGDLPAKRVERKCQQIESIVTATLKIAKEGQTIVEFCAGGGHVGLLLAYFLPKCQIVLIENKESSMQRATSRAKALNLKNIIYCQCNMDYFQSSFDIGVSLHACGVATDLVIQQCIKQQASFVCCPCCYGGIQNTHLLNYPLSNVFRNTELSYKQYTLLAHCADRTEVNTPTAVQGELCMGLIDTDRKYKAQEYGYTVNLTTLQPKSCSPKHNLLIGISPKQKDHCL